MSSVRRILVIVLIVAALYPAAVFGVYYTIPLHNAELGTVDTIIVLGCPTNPDGTPTPEQRERVLEAVREFQRGTSSHIIMTGTAAHNRFVEAHSMALLAVASGVPAAAVVEEGQAHDTIQNIYYSAQIMKARGWRTAEVISSPYHLPRTALILRHYPELLWKTHASGWPPNYSFAARLKRRWSEANGCLHLRLVGFRPNKFLPN